MLLDSGEEALILLAGVGLGRFLNDVWRSDDHGETWSLVTSAPFAPRAAAATVATGGLILLAGGRGEDGCLDDLWMSPDAGLTWSELFVNGRLRPPALSGASLHCVDGQLILMGGFDGETHHNTLWQGLLKESSVSWTRHTAPWTPRYCHCVAQMGPLMLLTGGHGAEGDCRDTWTSPSLQFFCSAAVELSVLSRAITKRFGLSLELWETGILPHLLPSIALRLQRSGRSKKDSYRVASLDTPVCVWSDTKPIQIHHRHG